MTKPARNIEEILPLSPLQEGMLFHSIYDESEVDVYTGQFVMDLVGHVDRDALYTAAEGLLKRHSNLRVGFRYEGLSEPVQVVARSVKVPWRDEDVSQAADVEAAAAELVKQDRWGRFDLRRSPLVRFMLNRLGGYRYRLAMTNHHLS